MNNEKQRSLQKIEFLPHLPIGFDKLADDEKLQVIKKLQDQDIEVMHEIRKKIGKSKVAENDLYTAIDVIQQMDQERKIYSHQSKGETGSGTYELKVRGGDTKFIIPILVVVGIIVVALLLILAVINSD